MYRAQLYSQTTQPPPMGSHKDRIMVERFFREKLIEREKYEILFLSAIKIASQSMDKDGITNFTKLIDAISGARWFNKNPEVIKDKKQADLDMLERVKALSGK